MRLAPLVALLLAAPALYAQTTPDPNPPEAYYPLAVGNQWEYRGYGSGGNTPRQRMRRTIVRDTLISGTQWFVLRTQQFRLDAPGWDLTGDGTSVVRFDAAAANVLRRRAGVTDTLYRCRLDLPLTDGPMVECGPPGALYSKRVETAGLAAGRVVLTTGTGTGFGSVLAAGIGDIGEYYDGDAGFGLVYARVGEETFGTPVDGMPNVPDTTPAADYYPLEVGNEWIYRYSEQSIYGTFDRLERRRVLREEAVGGQTYAVDQTCTYNLRDAAPQWACGTERRVRFDPATTNVVHLISASAGERVIVCQLGADFGAVRVCGPNGETGGPWTDEGRRSVAIGGQSVEPVRVKREASLANVPPPVYIAGIGEGERPVGAFQTSSFEFARVRGVEYGVRPVAGDAGAPVAEAFALTAAPNPTRGALRLALTLPEAQTVAVEAFDALGRRVWQQTAALGAGAQTLDVDASAWAPGVYVVRAAAGQAQATARVVRR